jgi:hypothetical protein
MATRFPARLMGSVLIGLAAAGCGRSNPPVSYDSDQARATLCQALEAWKAGQAGQLPRRKPPIRFVDEDHAAGWRLTDFEWADPSQTVRPYQPVGVKLVLRDRRGQTIDKRASYQVTLEPRLAVLRSDP